MEGSIKKARKRGSLARFVFLAIAQILVTSSSYALTVKFNSVTGFNEARLKKLLLARDYINHIVTTEEFKQKILNHSYKGKKQFNWNEGYTNQEIYDILMSGKETLNGQIDQEMDLEVELYKPKWYQSQKVIGYTYPNTTRIWVNVKYFDKFDTNEIAGNLMHEWIHKVGFGHQFKYDSTRPYTVPYAIGYMVVEMAKNFAN